MKTKIRIFIGLLISFLCSADMFAQTSYYTETKTFHENGYVYQCDVVQESKMVTLYNKENQLTYVDQIDKTTGKELPLFDELDDVVDDDWTRAKSEEIVNRAFSVEQKKAVKGRVLLISMYISPETGRVVEVKFETATFCPFAKIPVSVYRQIEVGLKDSIWFTPTADGRKLNYIYRGWNQEITE